MHHFEYRNGGELYAEDVPVSTLVAAYGTPVRLQRRHPAPAFHGLRLGLRRSAAPHLLFRQGQISTCRCSKP